MPAHPRRIARGARTIQADGRRELPVDEAPAHLGGHHRTSAQAASRRATSTVLMAATLPLTPSSTRGRLRCDDGHLRHIHGEPRSARALAAHCSGYHMVHLAADLTAG